MLFRTLVRKVVASNSSFQGGLNFAYGIEMAESDTRLVTSQKMNLIVNLE